MPLCSSLPRMSRAARASAWLLVCCLSVAAPADDASPARSSDGLPPAVNRKVDFVADVQPIFRACCFECHATGNEEGGLNLGTRSRVMEGGDGGPILTAGDSVASRLIHRVASVDESSVMPPEGDRLSNEQIGILRAWIDQGAEWPPEADIADPRTERAREHWAFQSLQSVTPPEIDRGRWGANPIDRFLLARLDDEGLAPSPPANSRQLMRRIVFDLTGLPPTPEELDAFVAACEVDREDALQSLVDRLLASTHYGERWGRHWLDVARYADSDGQEGDKDRPHAYHYRDFVIRAFNDDMPFDRFVRWQLAGDEYEPDNRAAVAATGFIVAGPHTVLGDTFLEEELLRNRYNELDDMVATTGTALLGLTFGCARCHDHKYDAISAREYYRFLSAFHSGDRKEVKIGGKGPKILAFEDFGPEPATTWLFERADFYDRDQQVQLGFLEVLLRGTTVDDYHASESDRPKPDSTYQRHALAEWLTDVERGAGPLLARVIVNRLWQHHFGEGLVRTVDDFGVRGESPTHPELLEWLAHDLAANGWRLKRLHRLMMTSAAYQQGTEFDPEKAAIDPAHRLLWRRRPQRLEAEALRDAMLAISGTLNLEPFGPAFKPPIPKEAIAARNLKSEYPADAKDDPATRRRTVYMFHKRVVPYPLLQAFDRPDLLQSCGRRDQSTVAPQALALLNDPFVRARASDFATRLVNECGDENGLLVMRAFNLALGRLPRDSEHAAAVTFIANQQRQRETRDAEQTAADIRHAAVTDFCQTLFGLNEFAYVD
ncbi:MAG: PSD1 domain-containing protein [Planctomycetaceae bacterium]|nr:PSD1 domain-containing protein [Planctomycetaceae bacterium]